VLASGLSVAELVATAWASASTFRGSDKRGGANGARLRLAPAEQLGSESTGAAGAGAGMCWKGSGRPSTASQSDGKQVSLADLIVLAGGAAVEEAARAGGQTVEVPFRAGRTDATQEQTDAESFAALEPRADGFRNFQRKGFGGPAEAMLVDRAQLLGLSAPEMTVLVGGLRVLGANAGGSTHGVFTTRPGTLSNDFFVNLLDMGTEWTPSPEAPGSPMRAATGARGARKWSGTRVDLIFGSNSQLRAIAEVYAQDDAAGKFVADFVAAWSKVMELDR
jgi:catalase-peroxidase